MQIVEIREKVLEIEVPKYVEVEQPPPPKPALLADVPDETLLSYGVPAEWLVDVKAASEDMLFDVASHLPQEAAEARRHHCRAPEEQRPTASWRGRRASNRAAAATAETMVQRGRRFDNSRPAPNPISGPPMPSPMPSVVAQDRRPPSTGLSKMFADT